MKFTLNRKLRCMATLYKHGSEIGRIDTTTSTIAYMSDGNIMRNAGNGWKLWKKCKPGYTPEAAFAKAQERQQSGDDANPTRKELRKAMRGITASKRWMVMETLNLLGDDIDGAWSTLDDYGFPISLEEIQEIAGYHSAALRRQKELEAEAAKSKSTPEVSPVQKNVQSESDQVNAKVEQWAEQQALVLI